MMRATMMLWLAALCVLWAAPRPASAADALPFVLHEVGPGVYAAIDGPEGKSGSNAGFIIGDDGVLVVDAFFDPEAAKALLGEIHRLTPKPVRYLVNTHYHIDHVGGDAVFRAAGAVIIAHKNVRGWVRTENIHLFGDRITPAERAQIAALALPDLTTEHDLTIWLGARKVSVRVVKGHTGGDLAVAAPDAHVLFCGDLLWRKVPPNIIDGTVSQWIATVDGFQHAPDAAETTFIPGHGDVAKIADVADFETYLTDLRRLTAEGRQDGLTGQPLVAAVLPKLKALHGDWERIDRSAPREIGYMNAELAGTKRVPVPVD